MSTQREFYAVSKKMSTKKIKIKGKRTSNVSPFVTHKHLRDLSPVEKTLPRNFSLKREVAYLFEPDKPKFGPYKSPERILNE